MRIGLDCGTKHNVILTLAFAKEGFPQCKLIGNIDAGDLHTHVYGYHRTKLKLGDAKVEIAVVQVSVSTRWR